MRLLRLVLVWALAGVACHSLAAQPVQVRTLEEDARGRTVEVTARWSTSLRAALDTARVEVLDEAAVTAATAGQPEADELLYLPGLALPHVTVLASDAEEVALPAPDGVPDSSLLGPLAEAVGLGWYRKAPVASLLVRLVRYDAGAGRLLRYRRVVVRVRYGTDTTRPQAALRAAANPHLAVTRSVLADGSAYRFPVSQEGVYRIDRDVIARMGLDPAQTDPARVHVYANGSAMLPAVNGAPRPADLVLNPVFVRGGGDGSFDSGDAVYVYVRGLTSWSLDTTTGTWAHATHLFSNETALFVKVLDAPAPTVPQRAYPALPAPERTQTLGRHVVEFDEFNWSPEAGSGLEWWSRTFSSTTPRTMLTSADLPGLVPGTVSYVTHAAVRSLNVSPAAALRFEVDGQPIYERTLGPVFTSSQTDLSARDRVLPTPGETFAHPYAGSAFTLQARVVEKATYPQTPVAAVDWIRAFYPQALEARGGYLRFATSPGDRGDLTLSLGGFGAEPQVWDVTDPTAPVRLGVQAAGGRYRVLVDASAPREVVAFTDAGVTPLTGVARRVPAQNLHGLAGFPTLAIVTPDTFRVQAEALAARRRTQGLEVVVASVREIYNEFSGGVPDMRAVRDYFKFLYDRAPDDASRLRHGLLYGDGHFDYRGLSAEAGLNNWIFPYETQESLDELGSYASDDYFGVLDDREGQWLDGALFERVDVGIGRIPAQTVADAQAAFDKIVRYESPETFGDWRTRYLFVADDGPTPSRNDQDLHVQNADFVAELVKTLTDQVTVQKVYGPSYERVFQTKTRLPGARRDILRALENGIVAFNYSGHGGTEVLADEEVFTRADAASLTNLDRLPVFITATCSFGRWDMQDLQSAAEVLVNNPAGGAVAMFTTIRVVVTSSSTTSLNVGVNRYLNLGLFTPDADGLPPRLGDAMLRLKQSPIGSDPNSRKFNLLGDPSLRFGVAPLHVRVDRVAGVPITDSTTAPIRALDRVRVEGRVTTADGTTASGYGGRVSLAVFDTERRVPLPYVSVMPTPYYLQRNSLIWRGSVPVEDGTFDATFVVPRDISYANESGLVLAYATLGDVHAAGGTQRVVVGGSVADVPDDDEGPSVRLFLNDTTFVAGGLVPSSPELIVRLADETGINTAGAGVGHEMLLVVNGDERNAVDIGSFFQADEGAFASGEVRYALDGLPSGPNTVEVRAWDVLNNARQAELPFVVTGTEALEVRNVLNFPNPMVASTRFVFEHNQPLGTPARVQVRVYTLSGRPVRTLGDAETLPLGTLDRGRVQISWDGLDDDGDRLAAGVYLYKVRVEVERDDGTREIAERIERLAVIR